MNQSKKNILFVVEASLKSGAGKCAIELIQHIKNCSEFEPIIVTQYSNDINEYCSKINVENYYTHYARTCSLGMGRLGWLIAFFMRPILNKISYYKLAKKIDFSKICLIHSNAISIDFGAYLHKKTGISHIWHVRDFLIFEKKWNSIIWNLPLYMKKNSSKIITVSDSLKELLIQKGCDNSGVQTIYDGIEMPQEEKADIAIHEKVSLNVACVGNICSLKGQEVLIDAIKLLPSDKRDYFHFHFWGDFDNEIKDKIMRSIQNNKLEPFVSFYGFSENIFQELKKMDIGVQPSHSEGFSRVTAEYMAAGLCVIAANEGAIPELIQDHETGFLYEDYKANELANLLLYCYNNQGEMKYCAKNAKEKAWREYDIKKNFGKILDTFRKNILHP